MGLAFMRERCIREQMDTMIRNANLTAPAAELTGVSIYHTFVVSAAGTIRLDKDCGRRVSL